MTNETNNAISTILLKYLRLNIRTSLNINVHQKYMRCKILEGFYFLPIENAPLHQSIETISVDHSRGDFTPTFK